MNIMHLLSFRILFFGRGAVVVGAGVGAELVGSMVVKVHFLDTSDGVKHV